MGGHLGEVRREVLRERNQLLDLVLNGFIGTVGTRLKLLIWRKSFDALQVVQASDVLPCGLRVGL